MRRKVVAGYARGDETRARILTVAINLFGTKGFDSVTTRDIAAAAHVPPASLRYYFQNKQGLYIACLEHIQALTFKRMEPALQQAESRLEGDRVDVEHLIDSFCALQEALIDTLMGGADEGVAALFMIRHDLPSEGGAGSLAGDGTAARRMMACFTKMMMQISGNTLDARSALIVAGLANGQLTNLYVRRARLRDIGWDMTPENLLWLKRTMRIHSTAILHAYAVGSSAPA
ncbi:TetR/AcrR family transcriptional regulator [Sphingomonas sp. SUN039]|uniref:TetR/AcrR family transcriptional regulator n=1 Tax=Sphingomonas sp. SUN039 TaxID=2937787 RepID=UPI0021647C79|nr:TetR/AcrR family transcriptional regulator [Sphingomonas sp. SUN039]UVO53675.1 TetR family transcriptional regulator [Sphingomonas sp. SUN039]